MIRFARLIENIIFSVFESNLILASLKNASIKKKMMII